MKSRQQSDNYRSRIMSLSIACPLCHKINTIPEPDVGRFATCEHCKEPYYVVVPPLEQGAPAGIKGDHATVISRAVPKVRVEVGARSAPDVSCEIFARWEHLQYFILYLQCITLALVGYLFLRSLW
jgi:hypothetical protein